VTSVILFSNGQSAEECDATGGAMKICCGAQKNNSQFYPLLTIPTYVGQDNYYSSFITHH